MADAGHEQENAAGARRRSGRIVPAIAALLLLGGGAALAIALLNQTAAPPRPSTDAAGSLHADSPSTTTAVPGPSATAGRRTSADPGLRPTRIRIPAIGVASPVTSIGLSRNGTLAVPKPGPDYDKAAWFTGSPAPGEVGPAVIEGHVDGKANGPSVFYRLGGVKPGNTVLVTRKDGTGVRFRVYAVRLYPKNAFPTLKVYGNTRARELRLITCGGSFNPHRAAGGYTSNVVVFARQA